MGENDRFNFHQENNVSQGKQNQFIEYQMPGYGNDHHRAYVPPIDPRYPPEMQGYGVPRQRPTHNQLPQVEFDYPAQQPVQGHRPGTARFNGGMDHHPMNPSYGPNGEYVDNFKKRPDSQYQAGAMDCMNMTPSDFAAQLSDGYIDNRDFQLRCRMEMRNGPQAVMNLCDAINHSLRQMHSPYHLGYEMIGNPQYGNRRLNVTFYGANGSTPGFLL